MGSPKISNRSMSDSVMAADPASFGTRVASGSRLCESGRHRYSHEQLFGQGIIRDAVWSRKIGILFDTEPAEFND